MVTVELITQSVSILLDNTNDEEVRNEEVRNEEVMDKIDVNDEVVPTN